MTKGEQGFTNRTLNFTVYGLLFLSAFFPLVTVWAYLGGRALPWWSDGGLWLKHMHAILGETGPMWDEGAYQYPPLYFLLLAAASFLLKNELLALKLTAVSVFCLRPLTTYLLAKKLFKGSLPALIAAWLVSVPPYAVEILGWGGYPTLLGLAILPVVFYSILNLVEKTSLKNTMTTVILVLIILLTHHLAFLVFVGALVLWVLALVSTKMKRESTVVGFTLLFVLVVFIAYRLVFAWPTQFVLFNEAAYHRLTLWANPGTIMWVFKDRLLLFLLFLTAFLSIVLSMEEREEKEKLTLLVAWAVAPILMSQGHLLGVTMDYLRVFMLTVQPLLILAAMPLSLLNKAIGGHSGLIHSLKRDMSIFFTSIRKGRLGCQGMASGKKLLIFSLVAITLAATSMNLALGVGTVRTVELYYRGIDYYGDGEKLEAMRWILENTSPEDVFVAEEKIGRWIEGLARRPVLLYQNPMFLFMGGEAERAYAARSILTSNYGIDNGFMWVLDQAPHGVFSPIIALYHKGDYEGLLYLDASSTQVEWAIDGKTCRETLLSASRIEVEWVERSDEQATMLVRYLMEGLTVERSVRVEKANRYVKFSFRVAPLQERVKPLLLNVTLNQMDGRAFWEMEKLPNKAIRLLTDIGLVNIRSTAQNAYPFLSDEDKKGIALIFSEDKDRGILDGEITVQADDSEGRASAVETYVRKEVMLEYGVRHIVLPRVFRVEWGTQFSQEPETLLIYDHLLRDETLPIAYENKRLIILKT